MLRQTFALMLRSLRVDARQKRFHLLRLGLGVIIALLLVFIQLVLMEDPMFSSSPGLLFFKFIVWTNAVFAALVGPLIFGASVTEEKEERTLALLKIANVRPISILAGKTIPLLIGMLLVLAIQFPFTLLAVTLGGVTLGQVSAAFVALTAFLIFSGMLSTFCSVVCRQTGNAVGAAGILLILFFAGPSLALVILGRLVQTGKPWLAAAAQTGMEWADFCRRQSLFTRISEVSGSGFSGGPVGVQVVSNVLLGALLFGLSWLVFDLFNSQTEEFVPTRRRRKRLAAAMNGPELPRRRVWAAALPWRDYYYLAGGKRLMVAKTIGYAALVVLVAATSAGYDLRNIDLKGTGQFTALIMFFCFLPVETTILAARTYRAEIKEKTLTSLTMVPLTTAELAYGKLAGSLLALVPALGFLAVGLILDPDILSNMIEGLAERPGAFLLTVVNYITQFLLFLHLAVFFSILWNTWAGIAVAAVVHYFGAAIVIAAVTMVFVFGAFQGSGDELGYFLAFLAALVTSALILAMNLAIGRQLQLKAAES